MAVARNPFAAAPAPGAGGMGIAGPSHGGVADGATGPMLGRGSELERVYNMPQHMGHDGGVNCMTTVDDRVYTGGRDGQLFVWRGVPGPGGGFELVQDAAPIDLGSSVMSMCYDATSRWLFCGLWDGEIQAYCKDPMVQDRLPGHRLSVTALIVHSGVLVSASHDATVQCWTLNPQNGRYHPHGQPLQNPTGAITQTCIVDGSLWVAGQNGITCFDLASLQAKGTIPSTHQVTGLVDCQGFMVAAMRNGDLKVYDTLGNEKFNLPSRGEHTSNIALDIMMHPKENKPMILCGQQQGYVTAYDLPDFRPRGSFVCKQNSDIKAILDLKSGGLFMTGGAHGDIMVWQWTTPSGPQMAQQAPVASNPFAAAGQPQAAMASSPFAVAPGGGCGAGMPCGGAPCGAPPPGGGFGGDLMMG